MMVLTRAKNLLTMISKGDFETIENRVLTIGANYFNRKLHKPNEIDSAPLQDPNLAAKEEMKAKIAALKAKPVSEEKNWWQKLYLAPTFHMQEIGDPNLRQIYSPLYDPSYVNMRLHEQFREGAEHHSEYYYMPDWYHSLITKAITATKFEAKRNEKIQILDVGSGAGNTVIPLVNIFPRADILATELSLEMLVQMRRLLERGGWRDRCSLLQLDAENLNFKPESFDLIVGGAILHHLFNPEKTLDGVAKILKPGGVAFFFEPFAPGNMVLAIILQLILEKNFTEKEKLPEKMESYLNSYLNGVDTVWGIDKSDPKYKNIDDKWMFRKDYFRKLAANAGFEECELISLHSDTTPFATQLKQIVVIYGGVPEEQVPKWAWSTAEAYDKSFTTEQKLELTIEACVVLKKRLEPQG